MNDYGHDKTDNSANNTSNSNYKKSRSEEIARLLNKAAPENCEAIRKCFAKVRARKLKASRKIQKRLHFLNTWTTTSKKLLAGESPDSSSNGIDDRDTVISATTIMKSLTGAIPR